MSEAAAVGTQPSRREFLRRAAVLSLSGALWGRRGVAGANNRLAVGVIGTGAMGSAHLAALTALPNVEVRAVCDVDGERLNRAALRTGRRAQGYTDYRAMLEAESLDAVVIATPDHQHATLAVRALEAGLDAYIEKPMAWSVSEGRAVVDTARRYGRIVQVGMQQRAQPHFRQVVELVRSGRLGEVKLCRCWTSARPDPPRPAAPPPPALDWDRWLGPAPYVPFCADRRANWRWYWDYGGGTLTDWGVHLIDIVHWAMGEDQPRTIEATGAYDATGAFETPTRLEVAYDYPSFHLGWSQNGFRGLPDKEYGILFYGAKGRLFVDRKGFQALGDGVRLDPLGPGDFLLPRVRGHLEEFLECVVTRQRPTCDAAVGQATTTACLLGNLAFRLGRRITWDGAHERCFGDSAADRLLSRVPRAGYGH